MEAHHENCFCNYIFLYSAHHFTSRFPLSYWWFTTFRPQEWVFDDISWMRLSHTPILFILPYILQGI